MPYFKVEVEAPSVFYGPELYVLRTYEERNEIMSEGPGGVRYIKREYKSRSKKDLDEICGIKHVLVQTH